MRTYLYSIVLFVATSCSGQQLYCDSMVAAVAGTDWVVTQYAEDGAVVNCWKVHGASVSSAADGIYWVDPGTGMLVHVAGWHNIVQVRDGNFIEAAALIGVNALHCGSGKYPVSKRIDVTTGTPSIVYVAP